MKFYRKFSKMNLFVFILIFGILCSVTIFFLKAEKNSVYSDYIFKSINPDSYLTTPEIIRRYGYPAESHIIQTEDGYLLSYHRIPHGKFDTASKNPYPIILHHGLLSCSADWIINGPEKSLAYRLADEGYDVWLANSRGSTESKAHVSLIPSQREFWNFSFHEMGKYDVPGAINYILDLTNKNKVIHIGHSQGNTVFYVFAVERPEMSNKVLLHISLAPTAMIPHTTTIFRNFLPLAKKMQATGEWFKKGPVMEYSPAVALLGKLVCSRLIFNFNLCEQLFIFRITGRDDEQFHTDLFTIMLTKMPAGTSTKNMIHSGQLISPGHFDQFDYGEEQNLIIYNQATPPHYDFSRIRIPIRFYHGDNDIIANPLDTQLLYQKLPKPMGCIRIPFEKWNHVDFLWAKDVNQLFNEDLLQFLRNVTEDKQFVKIATLKALEERRKAPVPVDIPFDEEAYKASQGSGSVNETVVPTYLQEMIENRLWHMA